MAGEASFGVFGLAVMGQNLARNLAGKGIPVAVYNRTAARTEELVREHGGEGPLIAAATVEEFVAAIRRPRPVLLMVKAGAPVDQTIGLLTPLLEAGDILIDGGNSHFEDTARRARGL